MVKLDRDKLDDRSTVVYNSVIDDFGEDVDGLFPDDVRTRNHLRRVSWLCADLGYVNRLNEGHVRIQGYSGFLHDVGKADVPGKVLKHPGGLETWMKRVMEGHVRRSFEELRGLGLEDVAQVVVRHHEFQRESYPRSSARRDGVGLAEILAAADISDALLSKRSYKDALPFGEARRIAGEEYTGDPKYLDQAFDRFWRPKQLREV